MKRHYDATAGELETSSGVGRFVSYDPASKEVLLEMDNSYLVAFDGSEVFIPTKGGSNDA